MKTQYIPRLVEWSEIAMFQACVLDLEEAKLQVELKKQVKLENEKRQDRVFFTGLKLFFAVPVVLIVIGLLTKML